MERKFNIGDTIYDQEGGCGTIIEITDTHYVCNTMCVPISSQDEYKLFGDSNVSYNNANGLTYSKKEIDPIVHEPTEQILENAIDFIFETQKDDDYICEMNGEWCEEHCIDTLRKECIIHYLKEVYEKENE